MNEPVKRNCPWGYSCTKKWHELLETRDEAIRFCTACQSEVYWVDDREELAEFVCLNRCVCFSSELITTDIESEHEWSELPERLLGFVSPGRSFDANKDEDVQDKSRTLPDIFDDDIPF